jgi:hypothetical protein
MKRCNESIVMELLDLEVNLSMVKPIGIIEVHHYRKREEEATMSSRRSSFCQIILLY